MHTRNRVLFPHHRLCLLYTSDEQDSDNNATEEKQPQQLTVEYTPADDIYVGNKVVPVVKADRADAAVDNLKYTVVEGKNLIEKDTDFASNGNYYNNKRTATVTITEHNFDTSRICLLYTSMRCTIRQSCMQQSVVREEHSVTCVHQACSRR